jgi:hypothetical protein
MLMLTMNIFHFFRISSNDNTHNKIDFLQQHYSEDPSNRKATDIVACNVVTGRSMSIAVERSARQSARFCG